MAPEFIAIADSSLKLSGLRMAFFIVAAPVAAFESIAFRLLSAFSDSGDFAEVPVCSLIMAQLIMIARKPRIIHRTLSCLVIYCYQRRGKSGVYSRCGQRPAPAWRAEALSLSSNPGTLRGGGCFSGRSSPAPIYHVVSLR